MESIWGLLWGHSWSYSPGPLGRVWASVYFQLDVYCHEIVVTVDLGTTNSDILESPAPLPVRMWLFWLVVRPSGDFQVSLWMSLWRKLVPWTTGLFPRQVWATACRSRPLTLTNYPACTFIFHWWLGQVHVSYMVYTFHFISGGSWLWGSSRFSHTPCWRVSYPGLLLPGLLESAMGTVMVFKEVIELSVTVSCFRGRGCWPYVQPGGPGAAFCPASTVKPVSPACLNLLRI